MQIPIIFHLHIFLKHVLLLRELSYSDVCSHWYSLISLLPPALLLKNGKFLGTQRDLLTCGVDFDSVVLQVSVETSPSRSNQAFC